MNYLWKPGGINTTEIYFKQSLIAFKLTQGLF